MVWDGTFYGTVEDMIEYKVDEVGERRVSWNESLTANGKVGSGYLLWGLGLWALNLGGKER